MVIIAPMQGAKKDKKRKAVANTFPASGHGVMMAAGGFHSLGFMPGMPAIVEQAHPSPPHPQSFHPPPPLQPSPLMVQGGQVHETCDKCSRTLELETEYLALRRKLGLLEKNYVRLFRQSLQQDKDRFKSSSLAKQQQAAEEAKQQQQHKTTVGNGAPAGPERGLQVITEFGHSVTLLPSGEVAPEDLVKKKAIRYERLLKPIDGPLTREEEIIKANLVRHDLDRLGYVEWHEGERGPRKRALPLSRPRVPATELSKKNMLRKAAEIERMIESQAAPPDTNRVTLRKSVGLIMTLLMERQKEADPIGQPVNLAAAAAISAGVTTMAGQPTVTPQAGATTLQHTGPQGTGMGDPTGLTVNPFTMGGMSMAMAGMAANSAAAAAAAAAMAAAAPVPSRTSGKGGRGRKEAVATTVSHEEEEGHGGGGGGGGGKRQKTGPGGGTSEEIPMLDPTGRQQQMLQQQQQLLAQHHAAIQQHWQQQQQQRRAEEGASETMDPRLMQQRLSVAAAATGGGFNPLGATQSLPQLPTAPAQGQSANTTDSGRKGDGGKQRPTLQQTYIPGGPYMLPGLNSQQTDQSSASNAQTQYFGTGPPFPGQPSVFGPPQAFGQAYGGHAGMPQSLPMLAPYAMQLVRPLVPPRQDGAAAQSAYMPVAQQAAAYTTKAQNQAQ